jgi:hypothetical protein
MIRTLLQLDSAAAAVSRGTMSSTAGTAFIVVPETRTAAA